MRPPVMATSAVELIFGDLGTFAASSDASLSRPLPARNRQGLQITGTAAVGSVGRIRQPPAKTCLRRGQLGVAHDTSESPAARATLVPRLPRACRPAGRPRSVTAA